MADEKPLPPHVRAVGITGGAFFLILAWMALGGAYSVGALLAIIFADGLHGIALRLVPAREAEGLWWVAIVALFLGLTYGMQLAIEFVGEQTGDPSQTDAGRIAQAIRRAGARPRAVEPHELPVTGPSPAEIERNRVR